LYRKARASQLLAESLDTGGDDLAGFGGMDPRRGCNWITRPFGRDAPRAVVRNYRRMGKGRLEAFSDGVIAIIITIMVLELKVPHNDTLAGLAPLWPVFLSYVLSFAYIGIYWNNHHHMLHAVKHVRGPVLWANLHLLFWLSLTPFTTAWMGENHFTTIPVAVYGLGLLMNAIAYYILVRMLIATHGHDSEFAARIGSDFKGIISPVMYIAAIGLAFVNAWISLAIYFAVAMIWFIPDRRFERSLGGP
jgi:uncharacterized membrane protein